MVTETVKPDGTPAWIASCGKCTWTTKPIFNKQGAERTFLGHLSRKHKGK